MGKEKKYFDRFNTYFSKIEKGLEKNFHSSVPLIEEICGHSLLGEGKRLRPLLFILSALMCGYEKKDIYSLSTIFEYIHSASLLHDDVIDNADTRRKKPSASNLWGNTAAVLTGDFMFSMAFNVAIEAKNLDILSIVNKTAVRMTEGQVRELICTRKWDTTEDEYMKIIKSKTAELISVSCEAGAVAANADKAVVEDLKNFGLNMGIAFQMIDDLLDYSSTEKEFGKPVGKDFKEGKITLPLIYSIAGMDESELKRFEDLFVNGSDNEKDYNDLINLVRESGGIEKTRNMAQEYVKKAAGYLKRFPESDYRDNLLSLNSYMLERIN